MLWLKTIFLTLLVPGVACFLIPYFIVKPSGLDMIPSLALRIIAVILMVLGVCGFSWVSQAFVRLGKGTPAPFEPPKEFVTRGLYRFVRNPMYIGAVMVILGEALLFASWRLLVYAAAVLTVLHLFVVLYEEPSLYKRFGEPYHRYLQSVPRWIPRFRSRSS
jgi:protein-S-isoprenylcysteine O-methyltransferase Ste14